MGDNINTPLFNIGGSNFSVFEVALMLGGAALAFVGYMHGHKSVLYLGIALIALGVIFALIPGGTTI
jgi:hypothetical protein